MRELKSRIRTANSKSAGKTAHSSGTDLDPEALEVKERLELFFGAPVKVEKNGDTGKIVISYYSPEELQNIISRLHEMPSEAEDEDDSDEFVV